MSGKFKAIRKHIKIFNGNFGNLLKVILTDAIMVALAWASSFIICKNFGTASTLIRIPVGAIFFLLSITLVWCYMGRVFYYRFNGMSKLWKVLFFLLVIATGILIGVTQFKTTMSLVATSEIDPAAEIVALGQLVLACYAIGLPIGYISGESARLIDEDD